MKIKICLFTIIILFMLSCNGNPETGSFDIYLIRDSEMSIYEFDSTDIKDIELPPNPTLSISDIASYRVNQSSGLALSHTIFTNSNMMSRFGGDNCLFVLVVNGERKYKGEYWANFMDTFPIEFTMIRLPDSMFQIITTGNSGSSKINDPEILNTLIDYGIEIDYYLL